MSFEASAIDKKEDLLPLVSKLKDEGYRFVTMSSVELNENEIDVLYHFDKDLALTNYRLKVKKNEPVPSISPVYFAAFVVENEIQAHFGLSFDRLVIDYKTTLYFDEEDKDVTTTPFCKYSIMNKKGNK